MKSTATAVSSKSFTRGRYHTNTSTEAFSHPRGGVTPWREIQPREGWGWEREGQGRRGKSWKQWSQQETQIRNKSWELPTHDLLCEKYPLSALPTRAFSLTSNTQTFFLPVPGIPSSLEHLEFLNHLWFLSLGQSAFWFLLSTQHDSMSGDCRLQYYPLEQRIK